MRDSPVLKLEQSGENWDRLVTGVPPEAEPEIRSRRSVAVWSQEAFLGE